MRVPCICLLALAGCTQILGIDELRGPNTGNPDARPPDAPLPDGPIPPTIQLSGTTQREGIGGMQPLPGVALEYITRGNVRQAMTTSDANGAFTLSVPSNGAGLDGFIRATATQTPAVTTDTYLVRPVFADTASLAIRMIEDGALDFIVTQCQTTRDAGRAIVIVYVQDAAGAPLQNATVMTQPSGRYCTLGGGGLPMNGNITGPNGIVFSFELTAGLVLASVTSGMSLPPRSVTANAGVITVVPFAP